MVAHEAGDPIKFFAGLFALFFVFPARGFCGTPTATPGASRSWPS